MGFLSVAYSNRWLVALAGLLFYIIYKIRGYNRLKAFKGPFSSGWFEIWHSYTILGDKEHLKYKEVCDKYGTIARVGPNDLITSSRDLLIHMSAVRSPYTRSLWFARAVRSRPGKDHVFSETNEETHLKKRQQMAPGYSGKENLELEGTVDVYVAKLVHLIRSKYLSTPEFSQSFDLGEKVMYFAIDLINMIAFGEAMGDLDTDSDRFDYIKATEIGMRLMVDLSALGFLPIIQIPWIARLIGPSETDGAGFGRVLRHIRTRIEARLEQGTDKRFDMLASFVRHGLTQDELLTEALLQIVAGSDTTATAIRSILLYVFTHPPVYARLQSEIDSTVTAGRAPPVPGIIADLDAKGLPYLQAVIREGMRIHTPAAGPFAKRVPDGGDTVVVDGKSVFLPGGTNINSAAYAVLLDKGVYGEDADEFRPERWLLEKDEAKLVLMHRTSDLTFGYGRYQCLGKPIALMEINKTVFELMRNFDWSLARPEKPWTQKNILGIFTQRDMLAHATERVQGGRG